MKVLKAAAAALLVAGSGLACSRAAGAPAQPQPRRAGRDRRAAGRRRRPGPRRAGRRAGRRPRRRAQRRRPLCGRLFPARDRPRARRPADVHDQAVDALVDSGLATPDELPSLLANQAVARLFGRRHGAHRAAARPDRRSRSRTMSRRSPITPSSSRASTAARPRPPTAPWRCSCSAARSPPTRPPAAPRARACTAARSPSPMTGRGRRSASPSSRRRRSPSPARSSPPIPSQVNWRDALLVYRDLAAADPALDLDIRRLHARHPVAGRRARLSRFRPGARPRRLPRRGQCGVRRRRVARHARYRQAGDRPGGRRRSTAASPPTAPALARLHAQGSAAAATAQQARAAADAHFAYGQYAEAAALYQAALQKGGEDPNLVNSRLGASLALAGRRPEAEAALRAVTGPRADLAGFWLVWLARRPA